MKTIVVERLHMNWKCEIRIDDCLIVDSLETGLYLAKEIVKIEQLHSSNVTVEEPQDNKKMWIVRHKHKLTGEQTFVIRVREIKPFTKDDIDLAISKILKS